MEILLTYNFSSATTEKITRYENLALDIKYIWKLNNPLGISAEGEVTKSFQKHLDILGLTLDIRH
jgi:hypothetical protein